VHEHGRLIVRRQALYVEWRLWECVASVIVRY
jgi:hypothetical protein